MRKYLKGIIALGTVATLLSGGFSTNNAADEMELPKVKSIKFLAADEPEVAKVKSIKLAADEMELPKVKSIKYNV